MKRYKGEHNFLCSLETERLQEKGFKVEREKKVSIDGINYIVDIFAERNGEILIIECGWTQKNRLKKLQKFFKTIHVPYLKCWLQTTPYIYQHLYYEGKLYRRYPIV